MIWLTWAAPCSQYPPIFTWREGNRGVSRQFLSQWGEGLPVVWKLLSQWPSFSEVRACKQGNLSLRRVYKPQQVGNPTLFCFLKKRMILYDGEFGLLPCLTSRFQTKSGKVNLSKFDLSWAALKMTSSYCEFLNSDQSPNLIFMFSSIFLVTHCQCMD